MGIISCPECGRQVSDKALKCPQCGYPIVNLENQEITALQVLQEKIQNVVSVNSLTVKVSPVGKSLNIKLTRTGIKILKPAYDQLWIKIRLQLKPDNLRGFNKLLIDSNFEGDIKSEWERQNDIDSTGKLTPNQQDLILAYVNVAIVVIIGIGGAFYFFNPFRSVPSSSSSFTSSISSSSNRYTMTNYNRINTGMTYSQVSTILGDSGKELSRVDIKGAPLTVSYQWQNTDGSNIIVMFQDDAVTTKAQALLK